MKLEHVGTNTLNKDMIKVLLGHTAIEVPSLHRRPAVKVCVTCSNISSDIPNLLRKLVDEILKVFIGCGCILESARV